MSYEIKKTDKTVYIAEKVSDKTIMRFEYWKTDTGWWIARELYNASASFPERNEIWVPDEVIDFITSTNAKEKLNS